jgi:polar amino acid transport system substrate-binding protein
LPALLEGSFVRRFVTSAVVLALAAGLAACGDGGRAAPSGQPGAPAGAFRTRMPGVLTVGTELPNPPFVLGDDLGHLRGGYEVDMVDEIARRLGIPRVEWVNFPFNALVAGGPCPCDFDVNGVSILPDRRRRMDFSAPYFTANQGVLVRKGTVVRTADDARRLRFGVQKDSSGARYLEDTLKPAGNARVYDSTTAAFEALRARQIDAVMSDVPIVLDGARQHADLTVAGQFRTEEQYGAVLARGSPDTGVLSDVIERLRREGFLDKLFQKYFPEQVTIPTLG